MFNCVVVLVMGWIVAAGSALQAPPTFFLGAWNNVAARPGGPASFAVDYRDGKTFVKIDRQAEREATVYVLMPPPSGSSPQPSALVVNADQRLFIIKRTDADKVVLEMFTNFSDERPPFYSSEPYAKGK